MLEQLAEAMQRGAPARTEMISAATRGLSAVTLTVVTPSVLLEVALVEARAGWSEGGIPIGAALFAVDGGLLGRGRDRRVQDDDQARHADTAAFGRPVGRAYPDTIMVTILSTCSRCPPR